MSSSDFSLDYQLYRVFSKCMLMKCNWLFKSSFISSSYILVDHDSAQSIVNVSRLTLSSRNVQLFNTGFSSRSSCCWRSLVFYNEQVAGSPSSRQK